jgi:hypothetical protein
MVNKSETWTASCLGYGTRRTNTSKYKGREVLRDRYNYLKNTFD